MIAISPSFWFDRKGKCPNCHLLIKVGTVECPHCEYKLTNVELAELKEEVDAQFMRSAKMGLFGIIGLLVLIGYFLR